MSLWSELVSTALVGTDRRPVPTPPADSPLAVPASGPASGPHRLLEVAAVVALARRAGLRPEQGVALPPPAPAETTAAVIPAAAARLSSLLRDQPRGQLAVEQRLTLVTEWLSLAARHRLRVPPSLLPPLLDAARARDQWRGPVAAVGGARAVWLAGQQPNWAWLLESSTTDESAWHEGTGSQRLAYLTGLRAERPDRARDLLTEAWPDEPPGNRAALLSALERRLTLADEDLLEEALDDRRKDVRVVAAALLAALPDSSYQRRMRERALACLALDRDGELVVTPPADCDPAMQRDGIEARPPQGTGERAWWFEQIVARTPLPAWREIESEPAALLRYPVADGWLDVVHRAWARATVDQRDPAWAAAFVRGDPDSPPGASPQSPAMSRVPGSAGALARAVHQRLDPADAPGIAVELLDADDPYAEFVLPACPRPWSDRLVAAAMARLGRFGDRPGTLLSTLVTQASFGFPPASSPAATELAERYRAEHGDEAHAPFYDRLADTLTFRHDMHREFE